MKKENYRELWFDAKNAQKLCIVLTNTLLGKGTFGDVFYAHNKENSSLKYAVKKIDRNNTNTDREKFKKEAQIMMKI